jgi:aryl-alcohol dehydrogenase-like predicted oxidoreductase
VIDLYQLRWSDVKDVPLEETWGVMGSLVDVGLVRWIGVSNFTAEAIERREHIRHVDSLQPHLSMLWQERLPLLSFCAGNGTGVIAYGPLAFGLLTGSITRQTSFAERLAKRQARPASVRAAVRSSEAGGQRGGRRRFEVDRGSTGHLSCSAGACVGPSSGRVTGAIAGRSPRHVRENAAAAPVKLPTADLAEIERILERRGGVVKL